MSETLVDENAYGALLTYVEVEDDEYSLDPEAFVERFELFRDTARDGLRAEPIADVVGVVEFGHATYLEFGDGDEKQDPFKWLKALRGRLTDAGFGCAAVLTHGSRWVPESEPDLPSTEFLGEMRVASVSRPSEPLRRALYAETATHEDDSGAHGWGPGLYIDTEAVEAMGKKLKNAPTPLSVAGATFYRFGT